MSIGLSTILAGPANTDAAAAAFWGHLGLTVAALLAVYGLTRQQPVRPWATGLMAAICAALALITFIGSDSTPLFNDFRIAYHPAGLAALEGGALRQLLEKGVDGFVNIPIVAYLFAPFGALDLRAASVVFTLLGLAATVAAWLILVRLTDPGVRGRWWLAVLFAANGPLLYSLKLGNTSHFILLALAAGLLLLRGGRSFTAGAILAAAALVKLPLLIFGPFFLLRRDVRGTLGFSIVLACAAAVSVALFGWEIHVRWFELSVSKYSSEWLAAFNNQSFQALLARAHTGLAHVYDWQSGYMAPSGERVALQAVTVSILLAALAAGIRKPGPQRVAHVAEQRRDLQYLLTITVALLSSPLAWSHYYAWTLMPAAFLLGARTASDASVPRWAGWTAILLTTPIVLYLPVAEYGLAAGLQQYWISYLLFAGLLWFGLLAWLLARTGGFLTPRQENQGAHEAERKDDIIRVPQ